MHFGASVHRPCTPSKSPAARCAEILTVLIIQCQLGYRDCNTTTYYKWQHYFCGRYTSCASPFDPSPLNGNPNHMSRRRCPFATHPSRFQCEAPNKHPTVRWLLRCVSLHLTFWVVRAHVLLAAQQIVPQCLMVLLLGSPWRLIIATPNSRRERGQVLF